MARTRELWESLVLPVGCALFPLTILYYNIIKLSWKTQPSCLQWRRNPKISQGPPPLEEQSAVPWLIFVLDLFHFISLVNNQNIAKILDTCQLVWWGNVSKILAIFWLKKCRWGEIHVTNTQKYKPVQGAGHEGKIENSWHEQKGKKHLLDHCPSSFKLFFRPTLFPAIAQESFPASFLVLWSQHR